MTDHDTSTATERSHRPPAATNAAQATLLDAATAAPLLVIGSPPPRGRDLDVLAGDAALPDLAARLAGAGFERHGDEWIRFRGRRAQAVDLVPASEWHLPAAEVERLFADADPIEGYERLRRPAASDELLVLARRSLGLHAPLAEKHRRRIAAALERDPAAWERAAARAGAWRVTARLEVLHVAMDGGRPDVRLRARAAREGAGRHLPAFGRRAARTGGVVALSGIDGSGKSTQAVALADALRDLGLEAVVEWSRITYDPALQAIAAPAKRLVAFAERLRGAPLAPPAPNEHAPWDAPPTPADLSARGLRRRVALLNHGWVLVVAVVHALGQRRTLRAHLREGRVVIRDRYVLDATVQLEDRYGEGRGAGLPGRLLRLLCPTPRAAFWLDVDPAAAYTRKPEEYSEAQLAAHRAQYEAAHRDLGVVRVDATGDADAVAAELAAQTWRRLR